MTTPKVKGNALTIMLPDGYNGHELKFYRKPIDEDELTVKLQCAEKNRSYQYKWAYKSELK